MKKIIVSITIFLLSSVTVYQSVEAAFEESAKIKGASFKVSSDKESLAKNSAVNFLVDLSKDASSANLSSTVTGPSFENINRNWSENYFVKINNNSNDTLKLTSTADYVEDIDSLRDDIFVKIIEWNDKNKDGVLGSGEEGSTLAYNSILRWRNDTFSLNNIGSMETLGFIFRFDGSGISEANLGKKAIFDFNLSATKED